MLPFQVSRSEVKLQDYDIDLDQITETFDGTIFNIDPLPIRSYEKDYDVQMDISIEMNLDFTTIQRTGYTFLDLLSDIGGIQGLLMSFIGILLSVFNYNNFDNFMAT